MTGAFSGLPEGTIFSTNGVQFQISYKGGDGNDVVLTQISPPPAPQFHGIIKTVSGQMQIDGNGLPGATYQVQASTNLNSTNWIVIANLTANALGTITFTDTNTFSHPMRFYRFVPP